VVKKIDIAMKTRSLQAAQRNNQYKMKKYINKKSLRFSTKAQVL